ncbi:hypothetical protein GCM10022244_23270 [Streptomyces gulbargensis]|uniref:Secreted protein n=1 Tax=Streptomyces gulbargensis TaxID=364901 RepID=A0ABP7M250_9ACTN
MTYPPNAPAAPAARGVATASAGPAGVPAQPSATTAPPSPGSPDGSSAVEPGGRGAWAVARERLREAATTEPGRLQILGAVLALLVVAFGAVTAYEVADRASASEDVVHRSQPLSADAAAVYRSLADADSTAAAGVLAGTLEPAESRARYLRDIATASRLLVKAAAQTDGSSASGREITTLNEQLPRYTGLVERARAANRQGLPLGGAYLRYANQQMTRHMLPAAERLYAAETERLRRDDDAARAWPVASLAVGLLALGVLAWAQRRHYTRTHRVFSPGLLAATAASLAVLVWLLAAHTVARSELSTARAQGQASLQLLNEARISSLKARANENLTQVARGAVLTEDGKDDKYEADYATAMEALTTALAGARELADDDAGRGPVDEAAARAAEWKERHTAARALGEGGDFLGALRLIIGPKGTTGETFDRVDAALERGLAHEQAEFTRAADDAGDALAALPAGATALGFLGALGALLGINRRLSEYR